MIRRIRGRLAGFVLTFALLTTAGCTSPGTPAPPLLELEATAVPSLVDAAAVGLVETSTQASATAAGTTTAALAAFPALAARAAQLLTGLGLGEVGALDVVAADRQILGVRIGAAESDGDASVLYGDVGSGATWAARDLLAPASAERLARAVEDAASDGDLLAPDPLADLRFTAAGELVVVDPGADRAWRVVQADEVVLSDAGRLVRAAARQGGTFLGPVTSDPLVVSPAVVPLPPLPLPPEPPPATGPPPVDCAVLRCVAITFDDGPGTETPRLLQELAARGVLATFFLVGNRVGANAATARAIADAGHAIGNHTWSHPDLTKVDEATRLSEIDRTTQAITEATGRRPTSVRPPYGAIDDAVGADLAAAGFPAVLWSVDSRDWESKDAVATTAQVLDHVKPGSVVLLHDIHASTVDAVPGILDALAAQGYTFVTVDQLFGTMQPGQRYFARPPDQP